MFVKEGSIYVVEGLYVSSGSVCLFICVSVIKKRINKHEKQALESPGEKSVS